ncbi:hypothetical protein HDU86_003035 [Geranomyces michiganensis]|nr:hypothetical protein HDU86_003035 [Geranomyces michiganensis]
MLSSRLISAAAQRVAMPRHLARSAQSARQFPRVQMRRAHSEAPKAGAKDSPKQPAMRASTALVWTATAIGVGYFWMNEYAERISGKDAAPNAAISRAIGDAKTKASEAVETGKAKALDATADARAKAKQQAQEVTETVKGKASALKHQAEEKIDAAKHAVSDKTDEASKTVAAAKAKLQGAKDAVDGQIDAVKQKAEGLKSAATEKAQAVKSSADAKVDDAKKALSSKSGEVKEKVDDLKSKAAGAAAQAKDKAGELKGQAQAKTASAKQQLDSKIDDAKSMAGDLKKEAGDKVSELKKQAEDKVADAKKQASNKVDEVKNKGSDLKKQAESKAAEVNKQAQDKADDVREKASDVKKQVSNKVDDVKKDAKGAVESGKQQAKSAADGAKSMAAATAAKAGQAVEEVADALNLEPLADDTTVVFVLGGPGAGKGTQCSNLVRDYGFVHLSAGDLLRAEQNRSNSKYGELINHYIKEGQIVPMEITIALLHAAMKEAKSSRFLVDGFPRKMDQALKFEEAVCPSKFVLYYECPEQEMLKRLMKRGETSGRVDDNIESIKKRFKVFEDTSYPVIEHYKEQDKVQTVSCKQSIEDVYRQTRDIVEKELEL